MSVRQPFSWSILLALSLVMPAGADDEEEPTFTDEITVTATGEATPTADLPLPVTVVTRSEIDDAQADTVAEMLRRAPGVIVMQSGGTGALSSVFLRGANSNGTLVMIDGVRLNSPYFGGVDFSHLTTSGFDRIEVARGPYSALWGADAMGGVINLITGRARRGFHGSAFAEGGSDSWQRFEGSMAYGHEDFDIFATASTRSGNGGLDNSDFDISQAIVNAGWSWDDNSRIGLIYHDVDSGLGIPYTAPGQLTPARREENRQKTYAVPVEWQPSQNWRIEATTSLVERSFDFSDPDDPFGLISSQTTADTTQIRLASHVAAGEHTLSMGFEWREDEVTATTNFGTDLDDATGNTESFFVQDVWGLASRVDVIVGARWDRTESWGTELSPRAHIGWDLGGGFTLTGGYGESFREPSLGELRFPSSGNPELRPETSDSIEIGLDFRPPRPRAVSWQLNAFRSDVENLIVFDFASYTMENIGTATLKGIEAAVAVPHTPTLQSAIEVTWLDATDGSGQQLLRRPEWSGAYTLRGRVLGRLSGDLTVQYVGTRPDVDPQTYSTVTADSFVTTNLAAACELWQMISVTARVTNLFDRDYEEVYGYPSPGRRFAAGLRARW